MTCKNCGAQLTDDAAFCESCGTPTGAAAPANGTGSPEWFENDPSSMPVGGSGNIKLCTDGKYRWVYEFPLMRNFTILFTIWKVFLIAAAVPGLLVFFLQLSDYGFLAALKALVEVLGIVLGIVIGLSIIGYLIYALISGGKYIVLFEMGEEGIIHAQLPRQFKKAQVIGMIAALAGAASGNLTMTGAGLISASRSAMESTFKDVKKIIGSRKGHTIYVNAPLNNNQIYMEDADYDFVWNYITSRCPGAQLVP